MKSRVKRLAIPVGGLTAVGLVGGMLAAAPAQAAGDVASDPLATSGIAAKNVIAYWMNEKAANLIKASPYETLVVAKHVSKGGPSADSKPGTVPAIGDEKKSGGTSKNVNLPRTTGKVFFRGADGKPHWCSATSLQAKYRNLVATAGHCVYDTKSNKATLSRWVFIPGYYQGKAPWGIYVGKQAFTHYDFDVYEDGDRDYAFVTVYNGLKAGSGAWLNKAEWDWKQVDKATYKKYDPAIRRIRHGKYYIVKFTDVGRLGDNVGGQGLAYNQKLGKKVFVFGYPSGSHPDGNHAYSGQTLKWSYGKTFGAKAPAVKAEELIGVKSSFTGEGSSGSAWLLNYKSAKRIGYLNGVTSGVADTDGNNRIDTSVSPYFDGETYGVYKSAANVWSGSIA
ncbi:trypsin-like serine peptidase [Sphaerimonospora sp. CA-214678]|uniref:trypsin-like serine peptidase n=1 Tax=Sphaerimonospora sp. CA-214678 TaxID=3240029 RepID=UPI003D8F6F71